MDSPMLFLACLLFVSMHQAEGTLRLDINPKDITPGLTESLTVNCSFSLSEVSNMPGIISLIVSKSVMKENQLEQFKDLVSVNAFKPNEVTIDPEVDATVTGHIDVDSESFLSIEWASPTTDQTGLFKCEVNGMDHMGHPTEIFLISQVTPQQPDLDRLIDKISQLQGQLERQENLTKNQSTETDICQLQLEQLESPGKNQSDELTICQSQLGNQDNLVNNQTDEIDKLLSQTREQSEIISAQQSQLDKQSFKVTDIESKLNIVLAYFPFHISSEHNGHHYLLSKQDWKDSAVSAKTCEDYGSYLAQIENDNEHQFVKEFLGQHAGFDVALVSGTDTGHEGQWTFTGTNTDLVFYDWYPGYSGPTQSRNCIIMDKAYQWRWNDYYCTHSQIDWKFVCELEAV